MMRTSTRRRVNYNFDGVCLGHNNTLDCSLIPFVVCIISGGRQLVNQRNPQRHHQTVHGSGAHHGEVQAVQPARLVPQKAGGAP